MKDKSAEGGANEPLTDEQLWGEPNKTAHDGPGKMTQEEIDDRILEQTLEKRQE